MCMSWHVASEDAATSITSALVAGCRPSGARLLILMVNGANRLSGLTTPASASDATKGAQVCARSEKTTGMSEPHPLLADALNRHIDVSRFLADQRSRHGIGQALVSPVYPLPPR
ncbi:hypothetical protein AGR1B_pAt30256 [Agrobacterium fabacearum S56]|nr:hypothetical protein AGR1B_pAt30256 [Agrobacterium fabacearum S56]